MTAKKLIIVTGALAAGKSTFARRLGTELHLPCFVKDTFKSALCAGMSLSGRAESSRFSAIAFHAILYTTRQLMEAGYPLIVEGNFTPTGVKPTDEAGELSALVRQFGYSALTFRFTGDPAVLYDRFLTREGDPERGEANRLGFRPTPEQFGQWCRNLEPFRVGGEQVTVNTTQFAAVDFNALVRSAGKFLNS